MHRIKLLNILKKDGIQNVLKEEKLFFQELYCKETKCNNLEFLKCSKNLNSLHVT